MAQRNAKADATTKIRREIGDRLRGARARRRLKQTDLAELLRCSRLRIVHIEQGRADLSLVEALQITQALDLPQDYFTEGPWPIGKAEIGKDKVGQSRTL